MTPSRPKERDLDQAWPTLARRMVASLGIRDPHVVTAMNTVPRHKFLEGRWADEAYIDMPVPIGPEATISAPHMVALQAEWAEVSAGQHLLEIGSGSGYLVAVLAILVGDTGHVTGIEIEPTLVARARKALADLGLAARATIVTGDGRKGYPGASPYDRIVVSYAVPSPLPEAWSAQLTPTGFVVAPVESGGGTRLERCRPTAFGWDVEPGPPCVFVGQKPAPPSPL